jgi:hypothetical protein
MVFIPFGFYQKLMSPVVYEIKEILSKIHIQNQGQFW